jgi:hypothetical protein
LCPEALGKNTWEEGIDVIDIDMVDGNGMALTIRQAIVAVREKLPDHVEKEKTGRRSFTMPYGSPGGHATNNFRTGGQQHQNNQQQHQSNQQQWHSNQHQQQQHNYAHHQQNNMQADFQQQYQENACPTHVPLSF